MSNFKLTNSDVRLSEGISNASYGINCAVRSGLDDAIIKRAIQFSATREHGKSPDVEVTEEKRRELHAAVNVAKRFLAWSIETTPKAEVRLMLQNILSETV